MTEEVYFISSPFGNCLACVTDEKDSEFRGFSYRVTSGDRWTWSSTMLGGHVVMAKCLLHW